MISEAVEDYLKQTFKLQSRNEKVSLSDLANNLNVSAPSVTQMVKKLEKSGSIKYTPYQGIVLTEKGKKIALEVIRHHRLLELFLSEIMGYPLEKVHAEAEKLEHFISEDFEDLLNERLGNPTVDPHGDPIPSKDGRLNKKLYLALLEAPLNTYLDIKRVSDKNPEVLKYIAKLGLLPDTKLSILRKEPFDGPLVIKTKNKEIPIGRNIAKTIFVKVVSKTEGKK